MGVWDRQTGLSISEIDSFIDPSCESSYLKFLKQRERERESAIERERARLREI